MARIRSVKPTFWTDEKIGMLARDVRLTFLGLISAMADDHGRLPGVARLVRGAVYPFDEDISTVEVERHLTDLADRHLITRYQVNGAQYIHIRNWLRHQKVEKPSKSLIPEPPRTLPDDSPTVRGTFATERSESGAERKRAEEIKSGAEARARATPTKLSGVTLEDFLEKFYRGATPERRAEVQAQLAASLSPAGTRVRKNEFATARSASHLAKCMQEVMADPPNKPDAAIVWVLRKLSDPALNARGQTVTEAASDQTKRDSKLLDLYLAEKTTAGRAWATANPEEWKAIETSVDARLGMRDDAPMYETIRKTQLADAAGDAAGFPPFDDWRSGRQEMVTA